MFFFLLFVFERYSVHLTGTLSTQSLHCPLFSLGNCLQCSLLSWAETDSSQPCGKCDSVETNSPLHIPGTTAVNNRDFDFNTKPNMKITSTRTFPHSGQKCHTHTTATIPTSSAAHTLSEMQQCCTKIKLSFYICTHLKLF